HAHAHPKRTALTFIAQGQAQAVTSAELLAQARQAAAQLAAQGVGPGDVVLLVLQHSLELVYYFWGAALLGAVPSIFAFLTEKLDPQLYRQRIKTLVEHSEAKAVVTYLENQRELGELLAGLPVQLLVPDEASGAEAIPLEVTERNPQDI